MNERDRERSDASERLNVLERRVDELEGRPTAMQRSRSAIGGLIPEETRHHLRAAGREQLMAARTLLDYWIARLRDEPEPDRNEKPRHNIRVD